jgi:hypothetical protein
MPIPCLVLMVLKRKAIPNWLRKPVCACLLGIPFLAYLLFVPIHLLSEPHFSFPGIAVTDHGHGHHHDANHNHDHSKPGDEGNDSLPHAASDHDLVYLLAKDTIKLYACLIPVSYVPVGQVTLTVLYWFPLPTASPPETGPPLPRQPRAPPLV